jgi:hypothetical protein
MGRLCEIAGRPTPRSNTGSVTYVGLANQATLSEWRSVARALASEAGSELRLITWGSEGRHLRALQEDEGLCHVSVVSTFEAPLELTRIGDVLITPPSVSEGEAHIMEAVFCMPTMDWANLVSEEDVHPASHGSAGLVTS